MKRIPDCEIGDVVELQSVPGAWPLPDGAGDGFQVRLVAVAQTYRLVERDGREWRVHPANLVARRPRRPAGTVVPGPGRCRRSE